MLEIMAGQRFAAGLYNSCAGLESHERSEPGPPVDRTVAHMNVEHYRRLLAIETDEARRQTLQRLLAEEEDKIIDSRPPEKA
jgi:hypothetical protein